MHKDIAFFSPRIKDTVVINTAMVTSLACYFSRPLQRSRHPASHQAFGLLQTRVCEQLPIPKSKRRAERGLELTPNGVNDPGLLHVNQPQETPFIVKKDPNTVRLAHQCHGNYLIAGHGKPLPLSITKHPGGAVGAHAVVSGHRCLGHTQTKFLRLFHRHLPVVSSAADLLVAEHDSPVSETLRVILDLAGVKAHHTIDDACVFLEEVQTAVGCSLVEPELQT